MAPTRRDPLFGAAVLKLSFSLREPEGLEAFRFVYDGVLRDLKVTDADVDRYLAEHLPEVEAAVRGRKG